MTDQTTGAVQENTAHTAEGGDQAGAGSMLTTPPAGDEAQKPDQAGATEQAEQGNGDTQTDDKDAETGAPEKYEFKMPEGMEVDQEALAEFEPIARELNLTNEQAQKLADVYARRMESLADKQSDAQVAQLEKWVSDIKADQEIGGQHMDKSVNYARAAIDKFGTPELKSAMDATGMGNHPELVRVFARIGKAMAEDTFLSPGSAGKENDPAKKMFPSMS